MSPNVSSPRFLTSNPVTQAHFCARRARVLAALDGAVLLVPAAPTSIRNNDVEHEYRQDSDFYYLSGFGEPEAVLLLGAKPEQPFIAFVRSRDPVREVWDGPRAGIEGMTTVYGADAAHPYGELQARLPALLKGHSRLYFRFGVDPVMDALVIQALAKTRNLTKRGGFWPTEVVDPSVLLHEQRVLKQAEELAILEEAVRITADAHVEAMARARAGVFEFEVEAWLRATFRRQGSERVAYAPIVGSGPNATILHYVENRRRLEDGDLLLIDAGCELHYYAADVTRTFPVNGRFSPAQRRVYQIVLDAQLASIALAKPGATFEQMHDAGVEVIARGLIELGLIAGPLDAAIREKRYERFFMHRSGHYLGMDVHDVGSYYHGEVARSLEVGMVLTIEPGIYIAPNADDVAAEYRGIGVRIEDDLLIEASGVRVLSQIIPKTVEDVEQACA